MNGIISAIISLFMALSISGGMSNLGEESPQEAVDDFLNGLSSGDQQLYQLYADNSYVNFIGNTNCSDEDAKRLEEAVFANLDWKVTDSAVREGIAVCKLTVSNTDLSRVLKNYEKESHDYVMENLYDEKVTDKDTLSQACLDMYLGQLEKAAGGDAIRTVEIFIPMEADGYNGWRVILDEEIMKAITGGLVLPMEK